MLRFLLLASLLALAGLASFLPAQKTEVGTKHALLIGVNDYQSSAFEKLRYTERDVEELGKILIKAGYQVRILSASRGAKNKADLPTKANIDRELKSLLGKKVREDTLLFGFSGHGLLETVKEKEQSFLCPRDAQLNDHSTLINLGNLYDDFASCGAGAKLLLIDACRDRPKGKKNLNLAVLPQVPKGMGVLFSCKADERSFELPALEHGVFFHFVLKGLRGEAKLEDDYELTWNNLASYVTRQVSRESPRLIGAGGRQTPEQDSRFTGESPVLLVDQKEIVVGSIKMTLCRIPRGTFQMGGPDAERPLKKKGGTSETEKKVPEVVYRQVKIGYSKEFESKRFYMGKYEVTQGEFKAIMGYNPSYYSTDGNPATDGKYSSSSQPAGGAEHVKTLTPQQRERMPVENVNYEECVEFCKKLTEMEKKAGTGIVFRLPTEAEWEYCCRAGTTTRFHFGDTATNKDIVSGSAPVPVDDANFKEKANRFGLYHMHGNVREWCSNIYSTLKEAADPLSDPTGPSSGTLRVLRGGGLFVTQNNTTSSSARYRLPWATRNKANGFRVVCFVPLEK